MASLSSRPLACPVAGLAFLMLILSACGSGAVSSAPIPASPVQAAAVSPAPSVSPPAGGASPVIRSITPEATIAVPKVGWIASDGSMLWVLTRTGQVARLDPATNTTGTLTTVDFTPDNGAVTVNQRGLWLEDFSANLVYRLDPASLKVVAKIAVGSSPGGLAVDSKDGAVWVALHRGGTVDRIDPATNKVVATIHVVNAGSGGPHQLGLALGSVWVGVPNTSSVYRIDPATNKVVAKIDVPAGASPCGGFAFSDRAVWMSSCQDTTILTRIDPVTNKVVATIDLGGYGDDPIVVNGFPWMVVETINGGPARLVRIDPTTNTIDRTVSLGDAFLSVFAPVAGNTNLVEAAGSVWAMDATNGEVIRLPLTAFKP